MADEEYVIGMVVEGVANVNAAAAATDNLEARVDGVTAAAQQASGAFNAAIKASAASSTKLGAVAEQSTLRYNELAESFGKLGGPLGKLGQMGFGAADAFKKLSRSLGDGGAMAAVAAIGAAAAATAIAVLVVAALAAAAAIGALVAKLVQHTIEMADAANKVSILREALAGSATKAAELSASISRVASRVPLASSEVAKLGEKLYKSGKRGRELEEALLAASYEAAGLGKNPGPDLIARRMGNLDVIGSRLKDNIAALFAGAATTRATSRFGSALSGLTERFGENRAEGKALQTLLGALVAPLINGLTALMPIAVSVFRALVMLALDVAIAVVKARNAVLKMIPPETQAAIIAIVTSEDALTAATWTVVAVLGVCAVVAAALAAALLVLAVVALAAVLLAVLIVAAPFIALIAIIGVIVAAAYMFGAAIVHLVGTLGDLASAGSEAASGLIAGLVSGIRAGVGAVADAMRALAGSAIGALKSTLKIASPSQVFERFGAFTSEGFALGVESEAPAAVSALATLAEPPDVGAAPGAAARARPRLGAGGGASVSLSNVSFTFNGVDGAASAVDRFREAFVLALEGVALQSGAA